jgi:hypothetical protein
MMPLPEADAAPGEAATLIPINSDELTHSDEEDFSAVLRRMEEVAQR